MKGMINQPGGYGAAPVDEGEGWPLIITAAHELKSPLALVRQLALGLQSESLTDAERQRVLDQILLTSERGLRLTTNLTRQARLQDSLFELEPLSPAAVCEEVAHELAPLYHAHGRQIKVSASRRSLLAVANRDLLRRVMLNFGDNALHYSESDMPVELRASSLDHGRRIRIGVRDFGPAIPADIWQRLTKRLGRDRHIVHARPESSGLGLYVAGQFAEAMDGRLGAIRHRDGATFYIDVNASTQLSLL